MNDATNPKKTKQSKSKNEKNNATDKFKKPKTGNQLYSESKKERKNRQNQIRKMKINEFILKKRGIIDSDGNTSLQVAQNKSMSLTNLTQLIDITSYKIPPKICALIALNEDADLDLVINNINSTIISNLDNNTENYFYKLNSNVITYKIPNKLFKGQERLCFIKTSRNIYSVLDACKVADIVIFVSSCKKADYLKCKEDPFNNMHSIDNFGYDLLTTIKSQGLTDQICIIQHLSSIPIKHQNDIKFIYNRCFQGELTKVNKILTYYNNQEENNTANITNDLNQTSSIIRICCSLAPYTTNLQLRKHRSYMMCEDIRKSENGLYAEVYGYIRGNTLDEGKYIHITGFGDYKVSKIEIAQDPLPIKEKGPKSKNESKNESKKGTKMETKMEIEDNDKFQTNLNNPNTNAIIDDNIEHKKDTLNINNLPEKIGEYKPKKEEEKKEDLDIDDEIDFDIKIKDDDDDISYNSNKEDNENDEEELKRISNKHISKTSLQYRKKEDMEFIDEVDTPIDIPAKDRFKKYKGLESMKTGTWEPMENLPREYASIFSFEDIKNTFKFSVKSAHDNGQKISGHYIKITITNFNFEDLCHVRPDIPLVLSTLLNHERKLCVMHYKVSTNFEQDKDIIENLNKKVLECQCGFRRNIIKPIFSKELSIGGDKNKFEKYLEKDKYYVCTTYSQLTYANSPVIMFTRKNAGKDLSLVATGSTLESDAKKIILKKIILTGYPVKIKKKKAVVRYMFFNPVDVNYFKPVQLRTKNGLRGNIKESVGTHGYMKCVFNDFLKSNDTVCLNLYKRIFPVWFTESWRYKVFYGDKPDYSAYFQQDSRKEEDNKDIEMK